MPGTAGPLPIVRWLPALAAAIGAWLLLAWSGVPFSAVALHGLYWLLVAAIPGTLLWRWLNLRPASFLEEVAAGTTLGLAVQVTLTFLLGMAGVPRLAPLWAALVIIAFLTVPSLGRCWRTTAPGPLSLRASSGIATATLALIWWVANNGFRVDELRPLPGLPGQFYSPLLYGDLPFHQAMASAVLRGSNQYPFTAGVQIRYPLLPYEHVADLAAWTGIDLTVATMRLAWVIPLILAILLCAVIAHRLTGTGIGAVLGAVFSYFTASLWFSTAGALNLGVFWSLTQTVGQPLFHLAILLLVIFLRERLLTLPSALAFAVVTFAAAGSKATFPAKTLAALAGVCVIGWLVRARATRRIAVLGAIALVTFLAVMTTMLGFDANAAHGTRIDWGRDTLWFMNQFVPLGDTSTQPFWTAAFVLIVGMWLFGAVSAFAALGLRRRELDVWLLAGVGLAGMGGTMLGVTHGASQLYFLRGAWPLLGTLAAVGMADLIELAPSRTAKLSQFVGCEMPAGRRQRCWWWLITRPLLVGIASLTLGFTVAAAARLAFPRHAAFAGLRTYLRTVTPVLVVLAVALAAATAIWVFARRRRVMVAWSLALLVAFGVAQGASFEWLVHTAQASTRADIRLPLTPATGRVNDFPSHIPTDGALAARWLRDATAADALIATNIHCRERGVPVDAHCDARQFWVSALAERQVLLEGWTYSAPPPSLAPTFQLNRWIYWDPAFLVANDTAFAHPSAESLEWLRARGVGWLLADLGLASGNPALADHAELMFSSGDFAVFRLGD
ncbi:MAG: hypothetical protein FWG11_04070 [Promicromonosporaceae bacterium]|nr:hypothetical protein [Promicromonosporaceae bacterium]